MIEITWKCDDCGKERKTKAVFDPYGWEFKRGGEPPGEWGFMIETTKLRCPKCKKIRDKKFWKENPGAVCVA